MYKKLILAALMFLIGCDSSVVNNSGALPPIEFSGTIWAGNVRDAKVQFVGVDQYGQPQRQTDGTFFGDVYRSDLNGGFKGAIQGAYSGTLVGIATADIKTQIRCVLPDGCNNESGAAVSFGNWYAAPADFEMWGAVSSVTGLEVLNITPLTHLAISLAYGRFTSDGSISGNAILTPSLIYQANHRVKQLLKLSNGLHVNVTPWYEGLVATDTVAEIESAKHGLISIALQKLTPLKNNSSMETLQWWVDTFLENGGNFLKFIDADYPNKIDAKRLYQAAVDVEAEYQAAGKSTSALASASSVFEASISSFTTNAPMEFTPVIYDPDISTKIASAQEMVTMIGGWAADFELNDYSSFFNSGGVAEDITSTEADWEKYSQSLSPVLKSLVLPIVKVAEYGLTCIRSSVGACDDNHDLHDYATFTAGNNQISLDLTTTSVPLEDEATTYSRLKLIGSFDEDLGQTATKKTFAFTSAIINTAQGEITLSAVNGTLPSIVFWLDSGLINTKLPDPVKIDISIPEMSVVANSLVDPMQFNTSALDINLLGTRDVYAVSLGNSADYATSSPFHYNILYSNIEGKFSQEGGTGDSLDFRFTLNSKNANTYYSPNRFPDLEINIDATQFKNYASFNGGASGFIKDQGGWFTLPQSITSAELPDTVGVQQLPAVVNFFDRGNYDSWDSGVYTDLKTLLDLNYPDSAKLGTLVYPGGETALVIYQEASTDVGQLARQCVRVGEVWGCFTAQSVTSLGCDGSTLPSNINGVIPTFNWLKDNGCIPQVNIDGRGTYDINYPIPAESFVDTSEFSATLSQPIYLGIDSFYMSLASRFINSAGEEGPRVLLILNGTAPDLDNVTMGFSLTHDYIGGDSSSLLGIDSLIPYGDNSLWLAVGQSSTDQDALIYYIQQKNITLTVFGFDYSDLDSNLNSSHDYPLAVIRYDGQLLGTLRDENGLYVIRYIDGSWQIL
jgi:hypothetical protein